MGENFIEEQVKNFERRRNLAREDVKRRSLFERPEVTETQYTVNFDNGSEAKDGDTYFAAISRDGQRINVTQGHRVVGRIDGEGAKHLSKGLSEPGDPGVVSIRITEFSSLSGCGKAVIVKDE
jgi:hypothetical protein